MCLTFGDACRIQCIVYQKSDLVSSDQKRPPSIHNAWLHGRHISDALRRVLSCYILRAGGLSGTDTYHFDYMFSLDIVWRMHGWGGARFWPLHCQLNDVIDIICILYFFTGDSDQAGMLSHLKIVRYYVLLCDLMQFLLFFPWMIELLVTIIFSHIPAIFSFRPPFKDWIWRDNVDLLVSKFNFLLRRCVWGVSSTKA